MAESEIISALNSLRVCFESKLLVTDQIVEKFKSSMDSHFASLQQNKFSHSFSSPPNSSYPHGYTPSPPPNLSPNFSLTPNLTETFDLVKEFEKNYQENKTEVQRKSQEHCDVVESVVHDHLSSRGPSNTSSTVGDKSNALSMIEVLEREYAVRGEIVNFAQQIQEELEENPNFHPFDEILDRIPETATEVFSHSHGGASPATHMMVQLLLGSENEGISCSIPQYPLHSASIAFHGGSIIPYYLDEATRWILEVSDVKKQLETKPVSMIKVHDERFISQEDIVIIPCCKMDMLCHCWGVTFLEVSRRSLIFSLYALEEVYKDSFSLHLEGKVVLKGRRVDTTLRKREEY